MSKHPQKSTVFGWINILFSCWVFYLAGQQYAAGGMIALSMTLPLWVVLTAPFLTAAIRRLGNQWTWAGMAAGFGLLWFASGNWAATVLVWALCCAIPLAVSVVWPLHAKIKPLAMGALPLAGGIALGGALLFHKLRFGSWGVGLILQRIGLYFEIMIGEFQAMALPLYPAEMQEKMSAYFAFLQENASVLAFTVIYMAVYGLFGLFFWCVHSADRKAGKEGRGRLLGPWNTLIPSRGLSWAFIALYIATTFLGTGAAAQNFSAAVHLFGFLYIFIALYYFLQYLRKKNLPPMVSAAIVGALFIISYVSVGSLFPYTVVLYIGWWIATMPVKIVIQK